MVARIDPGAPAALCAVLYGRVPSMQVTVAGASFGVDEHLSAKVAAAVSVAADAVAVAVLFGGPS